MAELTITKASHHFKVSKITPRGREAVSAFARKLILYGKRRVPGNRYVSEPLKVFASRTDDASEYRFHINHLPEFFEHLKRFYLDKEGMVDVVQALVPLKKEVELALKEGWAPREDQTPAIDYIVAEGPSPRKLLEIQTGKGKSFMTMYSAWLLKALGVYIVRPKYLEKWKEDFQKTFHLEKNDLWVVRDTKDLQSLIFMAMEGEIPPKIILMGSSLLQIWIKMYEKFGAATLSMGYGCLPDQFFEILNSSLRVIDEVHEAFHLNFKIDLHTNVEKSISLSATMKSDDAFLNRMYEIAYPARERYKSETYHKYISATAVMYRFNKPDKIRSVDWRQKTYSHHLFEESVMRDKEVLKNYVTMIRAVIDSEYIADYRPGSRMLIYAAGTDMCTYLVNELRRWYGDLMIERYCGTLNDPYSNIMESDICVSTVQSAGTGVDIRFLRVVLLTHAISSTQSNVQGFGRLRDLKMDDVTPRFLWFTNIDNPKHMEYHNKKMEILEDKALFLNDMPYGAPI